jgi:hypothetical protein
LSTENNQPPRIPGGRAHNSCADNQQLPAAVAEPQWQKVPEKDSLQPQQQNLHEQAMDDSEKTAFVRNTSHLNAAPIVQPFSQPQVLFRDEGPEQNGKAYDMLLLDSMRLPKQLRSKSNNQQEETNYPQLDSQRDNMALSMRLNDLYLRVPINNVAGSEAMGRASQVNRGTMATPEESDSMDHFFDIPIDTWKSNTLSPTMDQTPFPTSTLNSTAPPSNASSLAHMAVIAVDSVSDISDLPATNAPLEERFEFIMECIMAIGLDNFDKLVTTYYVETFKESSPLANEQRLSRNRRLPKVIADLFCATKEWSTWERWGFHEEILKTTETMLISENSKARSAVDASIAPLLKAQNGTNTAHAEQAILVLKKKIPNEVSAHQKAQRNGQTWPRKPANGFTADYVRLIIADNMQLPNLWALMMALTAPNRAMWQQDCSSKALAIILLLHCAGRIPTEQLLDLIGACL